MVDPLGGVARLLAAALVDGVAWRSAAGEWLLWFAPGGGPPRFWEVPGPALGECPGALPGGGGSARQRGFLCGGVVLGWCAAVKDDLLDLAGGVSPRDELVQVVPVRLAR